MTRAPPPWGSETATVRTETAVELETDGQLGPFEPGFEAVL